MSPLLVTYVEHKARVHLHLLVLVVLELQPTDPFRRSSHFSAVESGGLRIASQDVLADGMIGKDCIFGRNSNQGCCGRLVNLAEGAIFVGFGVLDFVADEQGQSVRVLNRVER